MAIGRSFSSCDAEDKISDIDVNLDGIDQCG
jgi:hypothetical protein